MKSLNINAIFVRSKRSNLYSASTAFINATEASIEQPETLLKPSSTANTKN